MAWMDGWQMDGINPPMHASSGTGVCVTTSFFLEYYKSCDGISEGTEDLIRYLIRADITCSSPLLIPYIQ